MKNKIKTGAEKLFARRLMIVEAAVRCFIDAGFHQTGMREIAKQAGVSIGNLYNHFKSKDEILLTIAEIEAEELAGFIDILTQETEPCLALEQFVETYLSYAIKPENALITLEIISVAMRNQAISAGFKNNRKALISALAGAVAKCNAGQKGGAPENSVEGAKLILDLIEGFATRCVLEAEKPTAKARQLLSGMIKAAVASEQ